MFLTVLKAALTRVKNTPTRIRNLTAWLQTGQLLLRNFLKIITIAFICNPRLDMFKLFEETLTKLATSGRVRMLLYEEQYLLYSSSDLQVMHLLINLKFLSSALNVQVTVLNY